MLRKLNVKVSFSSLFVFVLLLIPFSIQIPAKGDEAVPIPEKDRLHFAAWNIQFLGAHKPLNSRVKGNNQFKAIAKILNKYDFIAIIELMPDDVKDEKAIDGKIELKDDADLRKILKILSDDHGRKFKYLISPPVGWTKHRYQEHYAFLYDEELVYVVSEDREDNKNGSLYHPPTEKPSNRKEKPDKFMRSPFWATFRAGNFDFSVVVVHPQYDYASIENKLMDEVYDDVQKKNGDEDDVLLVGDFNLHPCTETFEGLLYDDDYKVTPRFQLPQTTNIRDNKLYDNIFFDEEHLKEYLYSAIDRFDETEFGDDDGNAGWVSDHRPVWAVFSIDLEDDD